MPVLIRAIDIGTHGNRRMLEGRCWAGANGGAECTP
jgi:hypothetical protein